ncbi:shikimate kinase [Riemerella columbina]|uniref:shikimate kinase n=1 Tax=Riemerella columbina TaxID=103810 RepID=UPI00036BADA6|nr:shikimate kinase [Riemerella columbina]
MIITLLGYMGCGKSHISKTLSHSINFSLIDLDEEISKSYGAPIPEIFKEKGEIFFRKLEKQTLEHHLSTKNNIVLSLGGGTPAYYDNMSTINQHSTSIYLRTSVGTLFNRLRSEKAQRPMIAHLSDEDLPEFIAKHLFERQPYYSQAQYIIDTDRKSPESLVEEIKNLIPHLEH